MNGKNRSYLMGVVGGYLIYQAYQIYQNMNDPDAGMSPAMRILIIILFTMIGLALIVYGVILWKKSDKEEEKEQPPEDKNSMKS